MNYFKTSGFLSFKHFHQFHCINWQKHKKKKLLLLYYYLLPLVLVFVFVPILFTPKSSLHLNTSGRIVTLFLSHKSRKIPSAKAEIKTRTNRQFRTKPWCPGISDWFKDRGDREMRRWWDFIFPWFNFD